MPLSTQRNEKVNSIALHTFAAGLFHKASIESGGCPPSTRKLREPVPNNPESAEAQGVRFAKALGCDPAPEILACMRSKPANEIINTLKGGPGGPRALSEGKERYEFNTPKDAFNAIVTDTNFICPTRRFTRDMQKVQPQMYLYHFNFISPRSNLQEAGAPHGTQTLYIFGNLGTQPTSQDKAMAEAMSSYWINFAKTGNPNGQELKQWPAYINSEDVHMQFDNSNSAIGGELHKQSCDFFDSLAN